MTQSNLPTRTMRHCTTVVAPLETLFGALSTKSGIRGWWTPNCEFDEAGFMVSFENDSIRMYHRFDITDENAGHVRYTCIRHVGNPDWYLTTLDWRLRPTKDCVELHLRHENWSANSAMYATCDRGWPDFLASIKRYAETGVGNPVKN